jgi:potassium efflux system protein
MVGFGENALNFSIRIFVSELSNRLPVTHNLCIRLEKALREQKIEIPFPQRDIHIRSVTQEFVAPDKTVEATVPFQNR